MLCGGGVVFKVHPVLPFHAKTIHSVVISYDHLDIMEHQILYLGAQASYGCKRYSWPANHMPLE